MVVCAEVPTLPAGHRQVQEGAGWKKEERRSGVAAGIQPTRRGQGEAADMAVTSAVGSDTACSLLLVWVTFW